MMSTATAFTSPWTNRGSGPTSVHPTNVRIAITMTAGTNQADTVSARRWIGARDRCASPTSDTMRASSVSAPTRVASITNVPVPLTVPPVTGWPSDFVDRHRLTGHHRLVHGARAVLHDAIDGHTLARSDTQPIAYVHGLEGDVLFNAAGRQTMRNRRRQPQQTSDCRARAASGAKLQHLTEEHERDDDRRRLEVQRELATMRAEGRREPAREQDSDDAIEIRRAGAQTDQREHVQVAVHDGSPRALEERPPGPQDDRRREQRLQPSSCPRTKRLVQWTAGEHVRHHHGQERSGQNDGGAKPAPHVVELWIPVVQRHSPWLQRHPADRTRARLVADDLGMHRAGPLGPCRHRHRDRLQRHSAFRAGPWSDLTDLRIHRTGCTRCPPGGRVHRPRRAGGETVRDDRETARGTTRGEVVRRAIVLEMAHSLGRRDHHSADRVLDEGLVQRVGTGVAHACLMYWDGFASNFSLQRLLQK